MTAKLSVGEMLSKYLHLPSTRRLALKANTLVAGKPVLFHGTRTPLPILLQDQLTCPDFGIMAISLTRSPLVAAYWASIDRHEQDEVAAVLVLDRNELASRFKLEPFHYFDVPATGPNDEMEERILGRNVIQLSRYLVGVVVYGASDQMYASLAQAAPKWIVSAGTNSRLRVVHKNRAQLAFNFDEAGGPHSN